MSETKSPTEFGQAVQIQKRRDAVEASADLAPTEEP